MKREVLADLHEALVEELLRRVRSGEATAGDLGVARQMLKDNAVDCIAIPESPLARLALSMPFDDDKMDALRANGA